MCCMLCVPQARAASRELSDLSIGPVLTWTTQAMMDHKDKLLKIPGRNCDEQFYGCTLLTARNVRFSFAEVEKCQLRLHKFNT